MSAVAATSSTSRFEHGAVELAEHGYHVFPCRPRGKEPLTRNGFQDSTRDERKILHWWDSLPDANIGVDCGKTGIVVWDIDAKHGADPTEILAERDLQGAPVILTGEAPERDARHPNSLSGVRGAQVFFRGALKTTGKLTVPGTEIRGAGGYVVVPPSVHPSGVEYLGDLPPVAMLPETPAWLLELVDTTPAAPAEAVNGTIPKGEQHRTLVSLAGSMRRRGMDADEIEGALTVTNRKRLEDPASPQDIRRIAESVARYKPDDAIGATRSAEMNADAESAALALTDLFGLDKVGARVTAARVFGKGSSAPVEIDVSSGDTMTFASRKEMMRPQNVVAEVVSCTGAKPKLKQEHCSEAIGLIRQLAQIIEVDTDNDIATEWGRDFLDLAETFDVDINDQAQRWRAFELLGSRDPWGKHSDPRDPAQPLVLRHQDGSLFVRTLWFERYVKARESSATRNLIGSRMARVGWVRRGRHGDIKATAPGRQTVKIFPFWTVPAGWPLPEEKAA